MNLLFNYITVATNIAGDRLESAWDPRFTQKTVKVGGGKIMVWGYIQKWGCARDLQGGRQHQ